ncbi:LysR family transcriptional regulator [Arabiibacter massiliensis]|uniref:LysR family transcriptional regulator n=1 Tax=Arabiibacter massiliensis TaxID=1870985 RepID=UPI0009BA0093|nr:LysR family transcriptional regulator [Arabiibacter massiliensis]
MELHQLRYASCVARLGSVGKAAEELYISKQAISKAIRSLEGELGFVIFDREEGMRLTDEGRKLILHADAVLRELGEIDLLASARTSASSSREALRVAFKSFPLDYLFFNGENETFALVSEFVARTPGCELATFKLSDAATLKAVQEGLVDVGFVQGEYKREGIKSVPVSMMETRAITLEGNPLCEKAPLAVGDLKGVPVRSPFDFDLFTNRFIARCQSSGFEPRFHEVPLDDESIDAFCRAGGVHLQPYAPAMKAKFPQCVFMPFRPQDRDDLPLCMVYDERSIGPLALKLVNFVRGNVRVR